MSRASDVLVFTDLDDSLFSTLRKIPEALHEYTTLAARAADSAAGKNSFMTPTQAAMVDWLDLSRCIPVTARGTEAYSRVTLPFNGPVAILANGAVMVNRDGAVDQVWASSVNSVLQPLQPQILQLPDIMLQLATERTLDIRTWAVMEPSCGAVYAVAKSNNSATGEGLDNLLEDIRVHCSAKVPDWADHWRFHINGNNLSVTPSGVSKAIAVKHVLRERRTESPVLAIGLGDSASDLEFMRLCDMLMTPTHSQIDQLLA